jgi:hypothetical protein
VATSPAAEETEFGCLLDPPSNGFAFHVAAVKLAQRAVHVPATNCDDDEIVEGNVAIELG